jgi:2-hydroxy-6-oxonona-2,4-dienedioate hydrolase
MKQAKFVTVDGIKTRYFEAGSGENLVLVSGGSFGSYYNAYHWSLNFADLCSHFHVYALDKLGQGFTDNPKRDSDYTITAVIDHVYGFLQALDIKRATLVGHSRGALAVARIAVDHPELVKTLVILGSSTLPAEDPLTPPDFYKKLNENPPPIPDREFVRREPEANSYSNSHIKEDFVDAMLEIALLPKQQEARDKMERLSDDVFLPDVRRKKYETLDLISAGRLQAPTIIIWGFNDPSAPVKLGLDLFNLVSSVVDQSQLHVFNHAGHYVFREHAPEVNQLITNFAQSRP